MKKEEHEPAKVVGNVDLKKDQKNSSSGGLPDTGDKEPQMSFKPAPQGPLPSDVPDIDAPAGLMAEKPGGKPIGETTDGFAKEDELRSGGTDAPLPVATNGSASTTPQPTLNEKVAFIVRIVISTVASALDKIGMYPC